MDRNVKETGEEQYQNIFELLEEGYFEVDLKGNYTFVNDAVCKNYGASRDELLGMNYTEYMDEKTAANVYKLFNQVYKTGNPLRLLEWEITKKDGTKRIHETSISPIKKANGECVGFRGITRDVTERKIFEKEREKHITELQEAIAKVKILSGLLPICAYCKKIRNDEGYWTQIESYLHAHSEAEFSHGICPDCKEGLTENYLVKDGKSRKKLPSKGKVRKPAIP